MATGTVTRAQLSEAVYQEVGLSRNESADLVETVLKEIEDALVSAAVRQANGNLAAAARLLGMTRAQLVYRQKVKREK